LPSLSDIGRPSRHIPSRQLRGAIANDPEFSDFALTECRFVVPNYILHIVAGKRTIPFLAFGSYGHGPTRANPYYKADVSLLGGEGDLCSNVIEFGSEQRGHAVAEIIPNI
jgi:hypothetical protein